MRKSYLAQQFLQNHKEPHQIPSVACEYPFCFRSAEVFRSSLHSGRNDLAGRIHQQFGEPFEDFLNLLRVRFLEVRDGEIDANVADAAGDLRVGLEECQLMMPPE